METATLPADAISFVCTLVRDRSAIELDASKEYLIEARLAPLARQSGFDSTTNLVQEMRAKKRVELEDQVVEAMTTNETSFFRDGHPFEALRTTIIPELIENSGSKKTLNIWSAACSTGQEIYSIAMILREHFPELRNWKVDLLGTDISDDVLEKSKAGTYSQIEVNRGLPATLMTKYFQRAGMQWQVNDDLRSMTSFNKLNFIDPWPLMPKMDIVFMRNVLIYFCPQTKKSILQKLRSVLAPNGILFLGAAETTINLDSAFERVQVGDCSYYKIG